MRTKRINLCLFALCVSLVAVLAEANPLFEGWYADPQIRQFGERCWIYPTYSQDFKEQTFLDVFSSTDLKAWTKHSHVLTTNEVKWARGAMWAPDAHEKDGKYYLFFAANDAYPVGGKREDGEPQSEPGIGKYGGIGVAVADRPEGPYRDLIGKPLIDRFWNGAQPIDQYVFRHKDDWYMVYGGWGKCNLVRLASDFKSLVPFEDGRLWRDITPPGYTEGSVMFERKGVWYFMYSSGGWVNDTYRVKYCTASSPFGPFEYKGVVLSSQRPIATGAGHHSVLNIPGTDEWYICYHRRPIPNESPHHRVTCLDRLFFDSAGNILPVRMTANPGQVSVVAADGFVDWVDPLIGTASRRADDSNAAAMQPFVGVPFGMWQWTVMTRLSELGTVSFADADKKVLGFIGTRQPAPWMGEYGQISVMPQIGACDCCYETRGVAYDKAQAVFTPYYCRIPLANGIVAEVTGSSRCAMLRFRFPENETPRVILDASRKFVGEMSDRSPKAGAIHFLSDHLIEAWNADRADAKLGPPLTNCVARFRIETSRPIVAQGGGEEADDCHGWIEFARSVEPLVIKVSQSMIDFVQAEDNMCRECGAGFDFEAMRERARMAWEGQFRRIEIDADDKVKRIFYTGMYHALQFPREFGEYGRYYSAFDDKVHTGDSYTSYSLWDTYRSEHALLTLAASERVDGMVSALLQMYKEGGWLPKWPNPSYTGIMVGAPAEIMIAQAYACGFRGFDLKLAYEAVKHNATVPSPADERVKWTGRELWVGAPESRGGLTTYQTLGYVAADRTVESVSRTQDFGHADRAAAVLAKAVGAGEDAAYFSQRSGNYRNLWNQEREQFLPRFADGSWKLKPKYHWHDGDYTEQSAQTAVWNVPYDVSGLVGLLGGREPFERKLDGYFANMFFGGRSDGLSCHENETTHHIAYLYAAIGAYDRCAKTVRCILEKCYTTERWGMEGNDDCGSMSAWYILSSLGFYPLDPTTGEYVIGSPLVRSATVRIGAPFAPTAFRIVVKNQSRDNCRVRSVTLNGKPITDWKIRHADIVKGGELVFEMYAWKNDGDGTGQELLMRELDDGFLEPYPAWVEGKFAEIAVLRPYTKRAICIGTKEHDGGIRHPAEPKTSSKDFL